MGENAFMKILGLNAYHGDSSAALIIDGQLIAAAEEERFARIKHWAGFPAEAIRFCLDTPGLKLGDIDIVAINQDTSANLSRKICYVLAKHPDLGLVKDRLLNRRKRKRVDVMLENTFPGQRFRGKIHHVEHHMAHIASAFLVSPFEQAVNVSVDGFGDFASVAWGTGTRARISIDGRIYFPHSLGIFYEAMTQFLGFPYYGDEYKVMGLGPYGSPSCMDAMRKIVQLDPTGKFHLQLEYFRHHLDRVDYQWDNGQPTVGKLYSQELEKLLGPGRKTEDEITSYYKDLACSVQAMYEEAFFNLLNSLYREYGIDHLTLSGGCAMNSVANGKIYQKTPFTRAYIQPASGDAGGAIGAALHVWHKYNNSSQHFHMIHACWGPEFSREQIHELLNANENSIREKGCEVVYIQDENELCRITAAAIAQGNVTGWFQGRMEWGPRALGNRSILCDPRRADMKDILNKKIKRRESFRPFAPSILYEDVCDWFEEEDDVPFMTMVFPIRAQQRTKVPAITHVDGSARLHTVTRDANPRYFLLISAFKKITGIPILLNTSFNENEPVVCRPDEALDCFLRTEMDLLVLGNYVVRRSTQRVT